MALDAPSSTPAEERRLEGLGLHGGRRCALRIRGACGPTSLGAGGVRVALGALLVTQVDRATTVRLGDERAPGGAIDVAGVEHLLAAVQGLDAFAGLALEVEGGEVPLIDGCAAAFAEAIEAVLAQDGRDARAGRDAGIHDARVRRAETIDVDDARYVFTPSSPATASPVAPGAGPGPADATRIEVEVAYSAERFGVPLAGAARWDGERTTFLAAIAPARTFGARRELEALRARGLAAHLPAGAVVGLDVDEPGYAPRDAGEPVRHKLLDLLGDLALLGGRFRGGLHATRPSHAATAAALREARARGVFG